MCYFPERGGTFPHGVCPLPDVHIGMFTYSDRMIGDEVAAALDQLRGRD